MTFNTIDELNKGTELVLEHVVFSGENGFGKPHKLVRFDNDRGGSFWRVRKGDESNPEIVEFGEIVFVRDTGNIFEDWEWAQANDGIGVVNIMTDIDAIEALVAISKK